MENSSKLVTCTDVTGNPAPLGLMGFGMTTVLLNIHNLGVFELSAMILAMGIAYGGLAQVIAGIMEWKKGNTFATTAFISYGFFWLSLVLLILLPKMGLGSEPSNIALATYLIMWGLFTGVLYIATLKLTHALQFVFLSLTILFFLLAIGDITGNSTIKLIAAIVGVICGFSAIYTGLAQVINEVYKKDILPL